MKTNVLVTGAKGQLACCIKALFEKNNEDIDYTFASKMDLNITSKKEIVEYLDRHNFNYLINCAAYTNVDEAEDHKEMAFQVNALALENLAQCCKQKDIILIHISTDYVFDGTKQGAYSEDDATNPINNYGASKLKGEHFIREQLDRHYIIRASWLYSPYGKNFLKTIVNLVQDNKLLQVVDSQKGSPTSCFELAKFIHFLVCKEQVDFGTYHFSASNHTTWYGLAKEISSYFSNYDKSHLKSVENYKTKARRPTNSVLDISKVKNVYPYIISWEDGVEQVMKELEFI